MPLKVKDLRQKHGLSQQELSDKTGIPKGRINNWEQGNGKPKADDYTILKNFFDSIEINLSQSESGKDEKLGAKKTNELMKDANKEAALRAAYKTVVDGDTEYVLIPLKVLDKTQLVSIDELERKNGQIDFYHNLLGGLLENLELTPKPANSKKSKE